MNPRGAREAQVPARADLVVIPLSFAGNRRAVYRNPPARLVLVHDWIWSRHGSRRSAVVSWLLLKRVNLVVNVRERGAVRDMPLLQERPEPVQRAS